MDAKVVLFVHAHPDDETIVTGGTIALLGDAGVTVAVLTCTRGEMGEVVPGPLKFLEGDEAALSARREGELARAMHILGVTDHRYLGTAEARTPGLPPRRYRDSGMRWGPNGAQPLPDTSEESLCAATLDEVVGDIVSVIAKLQPTTVISYDRTGGYGHPDHLRVHEATSVAARELGVPFFMILPSGTSDDGTGGLDGDLVIDVTGVFDRKVAALQAYETQLTVGTGTITHSGGQVEPINTVERYRPSAPMVDDAGTRKRSLLVPSVLAAVGGVVIALVASVNHQVLSTVFGQPVWVGGAFALGIVATWLVGLRLMYGTRWVTLWAAIAMLVVIGTLATESPGGSVIIPANGPGRLWAYGPAVIAAVTLLWPQPRSWRRAKVDQDNSAGKEPDPQ